MRYLFALLLVLCSTPVWAVYDDATVVQIDPPNPQGLVNITVQFSGLGEPVIKRDLLVNGYYTKDMLNTWSAEQIIQLNGVKTLRTDIKVGDKLSATKPVVVTPITEVVP